jgi:hypothetical protein
MAFTIQEALEAGRLTKATFQGCDVRTEQLIPEAIRRELAALGHQLIGAASQGHVWLGAGGDDDPEGIHYGASSPRRGNT